MSIQSDENYLDTLHLEN